MKNQDRSRILIQNVHFNTERFNCNQFNEWETIENYLFIKKSAVYYFVNSSKLVFTFMTNTQIIPRISAELRIFKNDEIYIFKIKDGFTITNSYTAEYKTSIVLREFKEYFFHESVNNSEFFNSNKIRSTLLIMDTATSKNVKNQIDIKLKYKSMTKKFIMLCSKAYFGDKINPHDFDVWFTLTKNIGFDKIIFGNHSLYTNDNSKQNRFQRILNKHKNFVDVISIVCMPDLTDLGKRNDKTPKYIINGTKRPAWFYDPLAVITEIECYNNNKYDYDYIFLADNDEFVLPKLIQIKPTRIL